MMMACLLIIIACMAHYCNYWRKRKSPIDGDIITDVSWRVGRLEEEWKTLYRGGSSIPPLHPTQQSTICWNGIYVMNNEEAQEFGLQLWAEDDGNGGHLFFIDGGNNSLQMLVDWV